MNAMRFLFSFVRRPGCLALCLSVGAGGAGAAETNTPARPASYAAFQVVSDRNIFNPNRYARAKPRPYAPRSSRRTPPSFTLAGIMSYGQGATPGTYAFFDGTSGELRKVLQQDGTIADFKVAAITPDSVTLQRETNQTVLSVGMQMRQQSAGQWLLATQAVAGARNSYDDAASFPERRRGSGATSGDDAAAAPDGSDTNAVENVSGADPGNQPGDAAAEEPNASPTETLAVPPGPAGPAGDALQRLMQLRQQEEQQTGNR